MIYYQNLIKSLISIKFALISIFNSLNIELMNSKFILFWFPEPLVSNNLHMSLLLRPKCLSKLPKVKRRQNCPASFSSNLLWKVRIKLVFLTRGIFLLKASLHSSMLKSQEFDWKFEEVKHQPLMCYILHTSSKQTFPFRLPLGFFVKQQ